MAWEIGAIEYDPLFVPPVGGDEGPGEIPGGDFSGGEFPGDDFSGGAVPAFSKAHKWFVLGKFFLDSGTQYDAALPVTHPDYLYEGRVLQWGFVDRSIPVPTGLSQVGDCRIRMADTDRKWRDLLSHQTPRRRFIELRWCVENRSESEFPPFGTFEIKDVEFAAGDLTIIGRDVHFAWVFKKFPNLINRTNFPDLITGLDEAQMPVINGVVVSRPDNPQGVIPLPPISATRWGLAAHPVHRVVAIYRKFSGEGNFALVDPVEYTVTQDPPIIIEGIEYNLTFIDFYLEQDEGMEVRADVEGINYRGPFFGMPEVFAGSDGPLRNPVDFLINLLYVMLKSETEFPAFNIQSFIRVRNIFEILIIDLGSLGNLPYLCDGAITETLTCGEILARVLTSFELDLYCNRFGEFELNLTLGTDPHRPVFDDTFRIIRNSVRQRLANPTFNRIRFRFERNYGEDEWGSNEVFDNLPDQLALGKIEEDTVDLWFVRDFFTAQDVIRRRAEWLALGSFRIELDMPAPEVRNDIELAKLFGVTHYGGLELGGYVNAEFKTTGITTDLDEFKTTVRGVLRVPQQIENIRPGAGSGYGSVSTSGSGGSAGSSGCPGITARIPLGGTQGHIVTNDDVVDTDYYVFEVPLDVADYPGLTAAWWGLLADTSGGTVGAGYTVDLVDETGAVYDSILIANGMAKTTLPLRAFTPVGAHRYTIRMRATLGTSFDIFINRFEIFIDVVDSTRVVLRVPLMNTTGTAGGGNNDAGFNNLAATIHRVYDQASYGPAVVFYVPTWLLELSKNAGTTVTYKQEVRAAMEWAGFVHVTGYTVLRNLTSTNIATDSEVTVTTDVATLQTKPLTPGSNEFIDGDEFRVNFKLTPDPLAPVNGQYLAIFKNELVITIDCPNKVQLFHPIGSDCNTLISGGDQFELPHFRGIDSTKYEPDTQWFFEGSAEDTASTGSYTLIDGGASLTGTSGADVTALTGFSTTFVERKRTVALALTDGHTLFAKFTAGGPFTPGGSFLIAEVTR